MRDFQIPNRSMVCAANGMCATSHPIAAQTAIKILNQGGNAVDAAVSAAILLGFCEPQSTGIGGDCFALINSPGSEEILSINGSGRAPKGIDAEKIRSEGRNIIDPNHPEAVTIPGAVDAFCTMVNNHGQLGLEAVLEPAIQYAEEGVPVSPRVARDWLNDQSVLKGKASQFYLQNGKVPKVGDVFRAPMQAEVLKKIAKHGRSAFYEGEIAQDMVDTLQAHGGVHTLSDFANAKADYTHVISNDYRGYEIIEQPPNGQGAMALLILNILKNFNLEAMNPLGIERTHLELEIAKIAMHARNRIIADPDYTQELDHMLDLNVATQLAGQVKPNQVIADVGYTTHSALHKDTIYITVVDSNSMSVSLIYSIFHGFGSGIASDKYGILFHNRGAGFNLIPDHPNEIAPQKRPLHTIIPAMVRKDGKVIMSFGVMGGQYQAVGHARFLTNMFDYEMDIQQALDFPRCFYDEGLSLLEKGFPSDIRQKLANIGHQVAIPQDPLGGGQGIHIDHQRGVLIGGSDPRKDGCALGY